MHVICHWGALRLSFTLLTFTCILYTVQHFALATVQERRCVCRMFFYELIQWHTNSSGGKFPVEEILTTSHTMTEICKTFRLCVCAVCCVRVIIIVGMSMRAYFWCIRLRRNWRANAIGACMLLAVLLILHNLNWLTIKCCTQKMRTSVSLLNDLWVFV